MTTIPIEALERPTAYHRAFRRISGSTVAAVFLSQAWYWTNTLPLERDGWFYKTQAQMEEETGLTRREQETARRTLIASGLVEEKRKGIPAQLWFRLDVDAIAAAIRSAYKNGASVHTGMSDTYNQECAIPPNIHTESTPETTTEITVFPDAEKRKQNRPTSVPDDLDLTSGLLAWGEQESFTPDQLRAQVPQFLDHYRAKGEARKDWDASFRTWMRNARQWGHLDPASRSGSRSAPPTGDYIILDSGPGNTLVTFHATTEDETQEELRDNHKNFVAWARFGHYDEGTVGFNQWQRDYADRSLPQFRKKVKL